MAFHDKVGVTDKVEIILNGKVVQQKEESFKMICPKCGVDRAVQSCPNWGKPPGCCPMTGIAQ